jgi:hypothetical protein
MTMVLDVQFRRLGRMVGGVVGVAARRVRMVSGCLVVACLVVFGGFAMVRCRVLVVLRCLQVVLCCLFGHGSLQVVLNCDERMETMPNLLRECERQMKLHDNLGSARRKRLMLASRAAA